MTKTPTAADLRAETRNWLRRGVLPAAAAAACRRSAEAFPNVADWHNALADEWDRIAAKFPNKVIEALEIKRDYHLNLIAAVEKSGHLDDKPEQKATHRRHHEDRAAEYDAAILEINPDYEPKR